jgi:Membrane-associated sensor, integral membrane domain
MTSPDGTPDDGTSTAFEGEIGGPAFLSTLTAAAGERRIALAFLLLSGAVFLAIAPFARIPLAPVPGFIAIYQTALVITDLITAVFFFAQVDVTRSKAIPILASGYLFSAFLAVAHALSFPGLFSPSGLLGAGPQTTAWLYMFWHAGFPLFVIAYAQVSQRARDVKQSFTGDHFVLLVSVGSVLFACALIVLATRGHDALPTIMQGDHYTAEMTIIQLSIWFLSPLALILLWRQRPLSVLNLWLIVVMCAWFFDVTLSTIINMGRFDLGFYAGRVYGLVAGGFVLAMLVLESSKLYARLIIAQHLFGARVPNFCVKFTPLPGSQVEPLESNDRVLRYTFAFLIHESEKTLGAIVASISRLSIPAYRGLVILRDASSFSIHVANNILRIGTPPVGRLSIPTHGNRVILFDTVAFFIHLPEIGLSLGIPLVGRLSV